MYYEGRWTNPGRPRTSFSRRTRGSPGWLSAHRHREHGAQGPQVLEELPDGRLRGDGLVDQGDGAVEGVQDADLGLAVAQVAPAGGGEVHGDRVLVVAVEDGGGAAHRVGEDVPAGGEVVDLLRDDAPERLVHRVTDVGELLLAGDPGGEVDAVGDLGAAGVRAGRVGVDVVGAAAVLGRAGHDVILRVGAISQELENTSSSPLWGARASTKATNIFMTLILALGILICHFVVKTVCLLICKITQNRLLQAT